MMPDLPLNPELVGPSRSRLSLVPVEVVEREAAGEDLGGHDDHRSRDREDRGGDRGGDRSRDRSSDRDRGGDRDRDRDRGGEHFRTRERSRGPRNS